MCIHVLDACVYMSTSCVCSGLLHEAWVDNRKHQAASQGCTHKRGIKIWCVFVCATVVNSSDMTHETQAVCC